MYRSWRQGLRINWLLWIGIASLCASRLYVLPAWTCWRIMPRYCRSLCILYLSVLDEFRKCLCILHLSVLVAKLLDFILEFCTWVCWRNFAPKCAEEFRNFLCGFGPERACYEVMTAHYAILCLSVLTKFCTQVCWRFLQMFVKFCTWACLSKLCADEILHLSVPTSFANICAVLHRSVLVTKLLQFITQFCTWACWRILHLSVLTSFANVSAVAPTFCTWACLLQRFTVHYAILVPECADEICA